MKAEKPRKPTILKRFGRWYCGYRCRLHVDCMEGFVGRGKTPSFAYHAWKYQIEKYQ